MDLAAQNYRLHFLIIQGTRTKTDLWGDNLKRFPLLSTFFSVPFSCFPPFPPLLPFFSPSEDFFPWFLILFDLVPPFFNG